MRAFVIHLVLAAATKILMFVDPMPGITALSLTPMELVNWYYILIGLLSGIIAFFRILFATDDCDGKSEKNATKKD